MTNRKSFSSSFTSWSHTRLSADSSHSESSFSETVSDTNGQRVVTRVTVVNGKVTVEVENSGAEPEGTSA
jgi:hypothetical protein